MPHDLTTADLAAEMQEISRLNVEFQKMHLPYKRWEKSLSRCGATYHSGLDEVSDGMLEELPSAHMQMTGFILKRDRDARIKALHDRLMEQLSCMFSGHSYMHLIFGLTDAGNPAIDLKFDGISLHERRVTARYLAPKLVELANCLEGNQETRGPVRRFVVAYIDRITAVSPEQAIWKWLCLRHRKQAQLLMREAPGGALPDHKSLRQALKGTALYESFDTEESLARGLGLTFEREEERPIGYW